MAEATSVAAAPARHSYGEWINQVRELFQQNAAPQIHGRYLLLGLALLDPRVYRFLSQEGIFDGLIHEIDRNFSGTISAELLTEHGRRLWQRIGVRDSTETLSDDPADVDLLEREAFAEAVALRLRSMRLSDHNRTLLFHLHGPWGSGKTTVLRLLEKQLEVPDPALQGYKIDTRRWIVANFNAWQYQRSGPPWWSLVRAVTWQLVTKTWRKPWRVALLLAHRLTFWLTSGRRTILLAALAFAAILLMFLYFRSGSTDVIDGWKAVGAVASALSAVWVVALAVSKFFAPSSQQAADGFIGSRADPMKDLEQHLRRLIRDAGSPVAIFIDDLDRCEAQFVVQLLEGIQVLYRRAAVTIVVAADRRWLHQSFELVYDKFLGLGEPGRPLGVMFLEKTFQFSVSVPTMMPKQKAYYWNRLLRLTNQSPGLDQSKEARQAVLGAATEKEVLDKVKSLAHSDASPAYRRAFRQEAVRRLSAPDIEQEIEAHTLRDFACLLESNPRAMKRLVNAYGMLRAIDLLNERATQPQLLGLWAVLSLRWPELATWLEEHPEDADYLVGALPTPQEGRPKQIAALLLDLEARRVARGEGITGVHHGLDRASLVGMFGVNEQAAPNQSH